MTKTFNLTKPGLFITATGTDVGKTTIACGIASLLKQSGLGVGVSKPIASGCRKEREGLVCPDAEALAHFADCRQPLEIINPIRYRQPVAPAVAGETEEPRLDMNLIADSFAKLEKTNDCLLVEGVGGLWVPLDSERPQWTVLDLIKAVGYPVLIVADAGLGTLNHTGMTVALLKNAGCRVAGIVLNRHEPDVNRADPSMEANRRWLGKMCKTEVLAVAPQCQDVRPAKGQIPEDIFEALAMVHWPDLLKQSRFKGKKK